MKGILFLPLISHNSSTQIHHFDLIFRSLSLFGWACPSQAGGMGRTSGRGRRAGGGDGVEGGSGGRRCWSLRWSGRSLTCLDRFRTLY